MIDEIPRQRGITSASVENVPIPLTSFRVRNKGISHSPFGVHILDVIGKALRRCGRLRVTDYPSSDGNTTSQALSPC
jgi:hypothetical protein